MPREGDLTTRFILEDQWSKEGKKVETGFGKLTQVMKKTHGVMKDLRSLAIARIGFDILNKGIHAAIDSFAAIIKHGMEAENAVRRLDVALSMMGDETQATRERLDDLAVELEAVSVYSNTAVLAAEAYLTTLGVMPADLDRATRATLDLAAALQLDLQTAANLVGRASQGATEMLARYGIIIDMNIPKTQRFEALLGLLETKWAGRAQEEARTFAGVVAQIGNKFEALQENIGMILIQDPQLIAMFEQVSTSISELSKFVIENKDEIAEMARAVAATMASLAAFVAEWAGGAVKAGAAAGKVIDSFRDAEDGTINWTKALLSLSNPLGAVLGVGGEAASAVADVNEKAEDGGTKVGVLVTALNKLASSFAKISRDTPQEETFDFAEALAATAPLFEKAAADYAASLEGMNEAFLDASEEMRTGAEADDEFRRLSREQLMFDLLQMERDLGIALDEEWIRQQEAAGLTADEIKKKFQEVAKARQEAESQATRATVDAYIGTLGTIAALVEGGSKKQLEFTKSLQVAQALASGTAGAIRVFADLPWYQAIPAALAIAQRTDEAVRSIRGIKLGGGGKPPAPPAGGAAGGGGGPGIGEVGAGAAAGEVGAAPKSITVSANIEGMALVTDQELMAEKIAELVEYAAGFRVSA